LSGYGARTAAPTTSSRTPVRRAIRCFYSVYAWRGFRHQFNGGNLDDLGNRFAVTITRRPSTSDRAPAPSTPWTWGPHRCRRQVGTVAVYLYFLGRRRNGLCDFGILHRNNLVRRGNVVLGFSLR
jgi:hypothetical protein